MQYLLKFKTLIGYFIELNWPRVILNWIYYWIELAKNNFELNIFLNWILVFFLIEYFFELNPDNFLLNWKLNWIIFDSFLLNQKLNWIIFKRNSIIDWIVKLYLPWLPPTSQAHKNMEEKNSPRRRSKILPTWFWLFFKHNVVGELIQILIFHSSFSFSVLSDRLN